MFKSGNKVRVSDSVLRKVRFASEILGCTVEQFVERALMRECEKTLSLKSRHEGVVRDSEQEPTSGERAA